MRYLLYSILAGSIAGGALWSTQQAPSEPPEAAPPPPRIEEPSPPPSPPANDQASPESQEDELEPFTPSEKVPAGSAISFPVDI